MERLTITVSEMAKLLGISRPKAYDLANRADFPPYESERGLLFPKKLSIIG